MKCHLCGTENDEQSSYCKSCGFKFDKEQDDKQNIYEGEVITTDESNHENVNRDFEGEDYIKCPNCHSPNIHFVTIQSGSDYSAANGCCGFILFGPLGLLCGLLSNKRTATIRKCINCNHEF
ncbi:hypothetical protein [Haloplasma contractile]|uniref:Uncharacterized protein n=1 Tax=Haloplasma contractile SSD-17B TaxID=1033810 RepID=F7Q0W0_9MOLU|nr:hypothetical protein [Haloplasma contractile]ERJ11334.1 hypothetical protein HLPCO_002636 [Haloplasma contractile SSD-17B]